jgi:hypothetical protein
LLIESGEVKKVAFAGLFEAVNVLFRPLNLVLDEVVEMFQNQRVSKLLN